LEVSRDLYVHQLAGKMAEAAAEPIVASILAENRRLWAKVKAKVGTNPFGHIVYGVYRPVFPAAIQGSLAGEEASSNQSKSGWMINSFNGQEIGRNTGVNRLVQKLLNGKVQCTAGTSGFKEELANLILALKVKPNPRRQYIPPNCLQI
jgi:hypothetical protein